MAGLISSFLGLGAKALSAKTRRALRQAAVPVQHKIFRELLGQFAETEFGRANSLTSQLSYEKFRTQVPLRTYEQFLPYVEKMKRGASDILWPGRCNYFAISSGTTAGRTKYLPITPAMLGHFRKTGLDSLLYFCARRRSTEIFEGKHLFLGGSTTLAPLDAAKSPQVYAGDLSGITALEMPKWVDRHLYEPGREIAQIADWPRKIDAIVRRTAERDIRVVAGIPSWLLILAEALKKNAAERGKPIASLRALWPNLDCLIHGGVPIEPYRKELQSTFGSAVALHEVYPASEAFIAAQDADASEGLRLMTDAGVFYEFLPFADFDENRIAVLGAKAVPLDGVQPGIDYVLLLTTPAGFCRYIIGDVVRFVSINPPRLIYVGRTKLQLSAFGEHVIEKELTDALATVCRKHDWTIAQFHVAPLFANSLTGQKRGRHEWWIELKPLSTETPTGPLLAPELDGELMRLNDDYEAKRKGGGLEPPVVRLVMPGVFEKWMRQHGKWGGQNKMPRCRSDREIADELAELTRFAPDQF